MATNRFTGGALAVSKIYTLTIGGVAGAGNTIFVTIGTKTVTYTLIGGDSNTTALAALLVLLQAYTAPEFAGSWGCTFAAATASTITATANTAGIDFILTSGGTTSTLVAATTVANDGPNDWRSLANWTLGAIPVNTNDIVLDAGSVPIYFGLDQSAVTAGTYTRTASSTGQVGLPDYNVTDGYFEYRRTTLKLGVTNGNAVMLGYGPGGSGPALERYDFNATQPVISVFSTGAPVDPGNAALQISGTAAGATLLIDSGDVGVAVNVGETATVTTTRIGYVTSQASDVKLRGGTGATWVTILQAGGDVQVDSNVTTWTKTGGTSTQFSGTLGTLTQDSSACTHFWLSTGTLTAGTCRNGAVLDCSRDNGARTATNLTVIGGSALLDPTKSITFSNAFATDGPSLAASNLGVGTFSLQRS